MNIQDIAAEKAREKYPSNVYVEELSRYTNTFKQEGYISGWQDCLSHLAGSEGDIEETLKNKHTFISNYGRSMAIDEAIKCIQQHTASAVAKALGEKWVKVSDGGFENDVEYLCKDNRGNFHYVAKHTEDGWRVFQDITCSPEYYQPITPTTH